MSDGTQTPVRRKRWMLAVLLVSLAANLLIAGIVLGWALSPDGRRGHGDNIGAARGLISEPFVRALSPDDRRELVQSIVRDRSRIRENRDTLGQRFEALLAAIRSDAFDETTMRRLLDEQRQIAISRQEIGEALLLERLSEMSAEERSVYAERLEDLLARVKRRSR